LLLASIGPERLSGQPAAALAELVEQAAARLGAKWRTPEQLRKLAEQRVDEITERIKASNQSGALKHWNARYRAYRLSARANGAQAIGYWPFLEQAVMIPTVRSIAAGAGLI
jgi:hypothetical protein